MVHAAKGESGGLQIVQTTREDAYLGPKLDKQARFISLLHFSVISRLNISTHKLLASALIQRILNEDIKETCGALRNVNKAHAE
jgi:hypothetical protein